MSEKSSIPMPLSLVSKSQLRCCFCDGVLAALPPILDIVLLSAGCTHRVTSWLFLVSDNNHLSFDRQRTKPFHIYDSLNHMRLMCRKMCTSRLITLGCTRKTRRQKELGASVGTLVTVGLHAAGC